MPFVLNLGKQILKFRTVYAVHVLALSLALAFAVYLQAGRPDGLAELAEPRHAANFTSALSMLFYISANAVIVLLAPFIARFGIHEVDSARIKRELTWLRLAGFNLLFGIIWFAVLLVPPPSWMNPALCHFALTLHIAVLIQVMIHVNICKLRKL